MATPASSPATPWPWPRRVGLYALIAALPFSDFLQSGMVAFNGGAVMGGIGASPEEYSRIATLYAVIAISVLCVQGRLVDWLGWRRFVQASCVLLAAGGALCASSGSLAAFGFGRALMAMGAASFLSTGRLLVNQIPPSPRRFTGVRFFAGGLAWGVVAGPVLASYALSSQDWRAAFLVLLVPAAAMAALAQVLLPQHAPERRGTGIHAALLALMAGAFAVLHALQRAGFDYFSTPAFLYMALAIALPALGLFAWLDLGRKEPLIGWRSLGNRRYLAGMAVFLLAYVLLGADNTMLPLLLQRALELPPEFVARYVGTGALAGVASWIVLARLLPRAPGPMRYYALGFTALLYCAWQVSRLGEAAAPITVLPALLCHGAFIIVVLSTTAMQAFGKLQHDDKAFLSGMQVKNMLSHFGIAAGIGGATLFAQWRTSVHYSELGESLSPSNGALHQVLEQLTAHFAATFDAQAAPRLALAQVAAQLAHEAVFMAVLDYFQLLAWVAGGVLVALALSAVARALLVRVHASGSGAT